jgi:DNA-binding LacI/PurR family transcriptional regulator
VLHDHPYVTADKRARVEAAIQQTGYRPSLAGRQLRGMTGTAIALAVPDIRSPYFANLAHVVMTEARRREITLFIDETEGALDEERMTANGYPSRGIDGVIFCPIAISADELEALKSDIPTVLLGEFISGGSFDHVAIDSRDSAREVTEHLLAGGRRRFAFAGYCDPRGHVGPGQLRLEGTRDALAAAGIDPDSLLVFDRSRHTREAGWWVGNRLVDLGADIDALVGAADLLSVGAMAALQARGVAIPDDIAVVSWDDAPEAQFTAPPLSSVAHDMQAIARHAIDAIEARRDDPDRTPEQRVVPHRLVVRDSSDPSAHSVPPSQPPEAEPSRSQPPPSHDLENAGRPAIR